MRERGCIASSAWWRPQQNEQASVYRTTVGEFLDGRTYSCRCADAERSMFVPYDAEVARATLFTEILEAPSLLERVLAECADYGSKPLSEAPIVALHCAGCDRRIVVDGTHRLARLAIEGRQDASLDVLELSGHKWHAQTPDFNLVCQCPR